MMNMTKEPPVTIDYVEFIDICTDLMIEAVEQMKKENFSQNDIDLVMTGMFYAYGELKLKLFDIKVEE